MSDTPADTRRMPSNRDPVALAETARIFRAARLRRLAAEQADVQEAS